MSTKKETIEKAARKHPLKGDKLVYSDSDYLIYFKEWNSEASVPLRWVPVDLAMIGLDNLSGALKDFKGGNEAIEIVDALINQLNHIKSEFSKANLSKIQIAHAKYPH